MKKILSVTLLSGLLAFLAFAIDSGGPEPKAASADAAIVINEDTGLCGLPGSDANGNMIFGGFGTVTLRMENGNKVMLKCQGNVLNLSSSGQNYSDFLCGIIRPRGGFVLTTDSHASVGADAGNDDQRGNGNLTCTYVKP